MAKPGRKSASELAVVTPIQDHRPPVPDDMPEAQAVVWRSVTNRLPFDWFRAEHLPMLRAYCQHVAIAQRLSHEIEVFEPEWLTRDDGVQRFDVLSKLLDREHRIMLALARSMRITHQSQYDKGRAGREARVPEFQRPWERHT